MRLTTRNNTTKSLQISWTAIDTYTRCPFRYHLAHEQRLTPKTDNRAMSLGTLVHEGMATGLQEYHRRHYKLTLAELHTLLVRWYTEWELRESNEENYDAVHELAQLAQGIVYRTFEHLDVPTNWRSAVHNKHPMIEYEVNIPVTREIAFKGRVDWVAKNIQDGIIYIVDWKTKSTLDDDTQMINGSEFSSQLGLYQYAVRQLGIDVQGIVTYEILSALPKIPSLLQNNKGVSRANIKTDWLTYRKVVEQNGFDVQDYQDVYERLQGTKFWMPITEYMTTSELEWRWQYLLEWANKILAAPDRPMVLNSTCRWCPFNKICLAHIRNEDVDYLVREHFTFSEG